MQFTTAILSVLAAAGIVSATSEASGPFKPVGPFALKLQSSNSTYNNQYISGIHIGAAIDLAVPAGSPDKHFYLNGTESGYVGQDGTKYGSLYYNVYYPQIPFRGGLAIDPTSNVAQLWLSVAYENTNFSFDKSGKLLLDGVSRWFGCTSLTSYGPKFGINWEFGTAAPSTKDCVPVTIHKA